MIKHITLEIAVAEDEEMFNAPNSALETNLREAVRDAVVTTYKTAYNRVEVRKITIE